MSEKITSKMISRPSSDRDGPNRSHYNIPPSDPVRVRGLKPALLPTDRQPTAHAARQQTAGASASRI
jgi:hypothetical protein